MRADGVDDLCRQAALPRQLVQPLQHRLDRAAPSGHLGDALLLLLGGHDLAEPEPAHQRRNQEPLSDQRDDDHPEGEQEDVRKDQDLAAEAETLDKTIIAAVAKQPAQRDSANEQRIRDRLAAIATERNDLQKTFASEFPDYAALSNPLPLTGKEIQALLSADEALVLFSAGDKEGYVFALTRGGFDWKAIRVGGKALAEKVAAFRRVLDVDVLFPLLSLCDMACSLNWLPPTSFARWPGWSTAGPVQRR